MSIADRFLIVVDGSWLITSGKNPERLAAGLIALGTAVGYLEPGCRILVKFRGDGRQLVTDDQARLEHIGEGYFLRSTVLAQYLVTASSDRLVLLAFEGASDEARCVASSLATKVLTTIEDEDRLRMFDLPPENATVVEADSLVSAIYEAAATRDPDLFAIHADRFLDSPHIITALFSHLMSIRTEDNIRFPIQIKKIADVLRAELERRTAPPRIARVEKSHLELWSEVQGRRFGFLDGGAARIGSLPGLSPMALRVGIYSVRPGRDVPERESWTMRPYVVADLLDRQRRPAERPDSRRLQEAARYTLEPLTGLRHLDVFPDTTALFLHGPLVNQFTQYDEGEPNFVPFISPDFLAPLGITEAAVTARIEHLPSDSVGPLWNQFMSIYAYVMTEVQQSPIPILGVVERPTGRAVTLGVLAALEDDGAFTAAYTKRVREILEQYDITDDFLFGCILREGEYVTPIVINKNIPRRARERWWPVVRQFPSPAAMLLKSEDSNFPFRVEMNDAARLADAFLARFLYHTARLLPRYAFPVGLDIADKYAKIPDWLSRGISAELSATVLREAMKTGDVHLVAQLRLFLARGPRDFFYRPAV